MRRLRWTIVAALLLAVAVPGTASAASNVEYFGYFAARITPSGGDHLAEVADRSNLNWVQISDVDRYRPEVLDGCKPRGRLVSTGHEFFKGCDAAHSPSCDLYPDYAARWQRLAAAVASRIGKVGAFYLLDEPQWRGASPAEIATAAATIKATFPGVPVMMVEAGPASRRRCRSRRRSTGSASTGTARSCPSSRPSSRSWSAGPRPRSGSGCCPRRRRSPHAAASPATRPTRRSRRSSTATSSSPSGIRASSGCWPSASGRAATTRPTCRRRSRRTGRSPHASSARRRRLRRPAAPPPDAAAPVVKRVAVGKRRLRVDRRGRVRVRLACPRAATVPCTGRLTLTARVRKRTVRLARARFALAPGAHRVVRMRVHRRAAVRRVRLAVRTPAGNATLRVRSRGAAA